jgi:putative membrane protein
MDQYYNTIKAFTLIFVITWFVGLFISLGFFVYQIELEKPSPENSTETVQNNDLPMWYIITWPSAILASFLHFG